MATIAVQSGELAEDTENLPTSNENTPEESELIAEQAGTSGTEKFGTGLAEAKEVVESADNIEQNATATVSPVVRGKAAKSTKKKAKQAEIISTEPIETEPVETKEVVKAEEVVDTEQSTALATPATTATNPAVPEKAVKPAKAKKKAKKEDGYNASQLDDRFHRIVYQLGLNPTYEIPVVMGVTSAVRGEGRTTVALGLAKAIIQLMPVRVVLVETDLENPALAQDLNLQSHGLSEFIRGEVELEEVIQPTSQPDLFVVTAGNAQGQVLKTLRSENFGHLIEGLRQQFALVLLDLPPLADTGEATRAISQTDFVLMIVQAGSTPGKLVKNSLELVPEDKLIGVILNRTKPAVGIWGIFRRLFRR